MASDLILNGVAFNGTPGTNPTHPYKPNKLDMVEAKIGRTLVAANGRRRFVARSTYKRTWTLSWVTTNETTRAAVRALAELLTTWAMVDQFGTSRTVQTELDDYTEDYAMDDPAGNLYYNIKLIIREA